MEEDVDLERETKTFQLSTGLLVRGEGGYEFYGFVEGENQESRRLRYFYMLDDEWEGWEGFRCYYVRAGGDAVFINLTEKDAQVVVGAENSRPKVSPEMVQIEYGGEIVLAEMWVFENSECFEMLESWEEEDKELRESLLGVKWWELGNEEEGGRKAL